MSIKELESKARELRQLQALIEEAQQAIVRPYRQGSIKSPGRPSRPPESTPRP